MNTQPIFESKVSDNGSKLCIRSSQDRYTINPLCTLHNIDNDNDLLVNVPYWDKEGQKSNGNWNDIQTVQISFFSGEDYGPWRKNLENPPDAWRAIFRILQQRLSRNFYALEVITTKKNMAGSGVDEKILPLLPTYFPDIRRLDICTNGDMKLPQICKSIGKFQQLTDLRLGADDRAFSFQHFVLSVQCLTNLADSIEQLPFLRTFQMKKWIVGHDEEPEPGLEALYCALWKHPTLRLNTGDINRIGFRFNTGGDINRIDPISQECWDILGKGPSATQGLNQLRRQGRLPEGFPEDNQYRSGIISLEVWAAAVITGMGYDKNDRIFDYLMDWENQLSGEDFVAVAKIIQETINKATAAVRIQRQGRRLVCQRKFQKLKPSIKDLEEEAEGLEKEAERLLKAAKRKRDEKENLLASIRGKLSRGGG